MVGRAWPGAAARAAAASAAAAGVVEHLQRRALGGLHHADPGIGRTQQRQTRRVSRDHARRVQFDGHDGFGSGRPLAEAVAGGIEVVGRQRMQAQHAGLLGERPLGVIGHVIPLPVRIELAAVEVVVVDERRLGILRDAGVGLDPGVGRLAQIARQADEREAVVPGDGDQGDHAAGAAVVRHDDAPPLARGCIDTCRPDGASGRGRRSVTRAGATVGTPSDSPWTMRSTFQGPSMESARATI